MHRLYKACFTANVRWMTTTDEIPWSWLYYFLYVEFSDFMSINLSLDKLYQYSLPAIVLTCDRAPPRQRVTSRHCMFSIITLFLLFNHYLKNIIKIRFIFYLLFSTSSYRLLQRFYKFYFKTQRFWYLYHLKLSLNLS
jgi:hypothetical protein